MNYVFLENLVQQQINYVEKATEENHNQIASGLLKNSMFKEFIWKDFSSEQLLPNQIENELTFGEKPIVIQTLQEVLYKIQQKITA